MRLVAFLIVLLINAGQVFGQGGRVVCELPGEAPLSVTGVVTATRLTLNIEIAPDWHLYGHDSEGGEPVSVTIEGDAFEAAGPLVIPKAVDGQLEGGITLQLPIRRLKASAKSLTARFDFMACDPLSCLPPMSASLKAEVPKVRVLLVGGEQGKASNLLSAFLAERGFQCSSTTYAAVTAEQCSGHDVVLADSGTFRKRKAKLSDVHRFPKSDAPVVAVGFNGTELIEKHGLAMTSGYI